MIELEVKRDHPEVFANIDELAGNTYPGRVLAMGVSSCGNLAVQAYGIMGRSTGSRSRIFVDEGMGSVRTVAPGKTPEEMSATENAELIYYQASMAGSGVFVVSNGAQTRPVYEKSLDGATLEDSVKAAPIVGGVDLSKYEPDEPNYTPRITGIIDLREDAPTPAGISVVRKDLKTEEPIRSTYETEDVRNIAPGLGFMVHTYLGDGDPLPSFDQDPFAVLIEEDAVSTAHNLWRLLNRENRVALMTRSIDLETQKIVETCIINSPPN